MFTSTDLFITALIFTPFGICMGLMAAFWRPKGETQPRINMKV